MPPKPKLGVHISSPKTDYELLELLNEGDMAWALKARDCGNGQTVFLKYYKSPTPAVDWYGSYLAYVNELNRRLEDSSAAQYCVLCRDQFTANPKPGSPNKTEYFFQVYDFIEKGLDLRGALASNPEWEKRVAMAKVFLVCMKKIHEARVVHSDLKPENVQMLPRPGTALGLIPRLIDMDRSLLDDKPAPWTTGQIKEGYTGTPGYFSPEHLSGKKPQTASDVFTVGIILGELLGGRHPFSDNLADKACYRNAVLTGKLHDPVVLLGELGGTLGNAQQFAELIEQCFDTDPAKRPSCERLHKRLIELDRRSETPGGSPSATPLPSAPVPAAEPGPPPPEPKAAPAAPQALVLTGDTGAHTVRLPMDLGKVLLTRASTQAHYAGRQQFRLEKEGNAWYICPGTAENQPHTAVNGEILQDRRPLADGDRICLVGRRSGREAMELIVSFT